MERDSPSSPSRQELRSHSARRSRRVTPRAGLHQPLVNAAQAIPEGDFEKNEIRIVTTTDEHGRAVIEFHDSGEGISESAMRRIFDPFFTTKPIGVGTGLGLSICHGIVSGMNGTITAKNGEIRGAVLRVVLPAAV